MDYYHENILSDNYEGIKKSINLSYLLPCLSRRKLLTLNETDQLQNSNKSSIEKNCEFYHILKTKGCRAFALFLEALEEEKHHKGHRSLWTKLSQADAMQHSTMAVSGTKCNREPVSLKPRVYMQQKRRTFEAEMFIEDCESTHSDPSVSDPSESHSTGSSAQTVIASQHSGISQMTVVLNHHLESLMTTISQQFSEFKAEIDKRLEVLESKVDEQSELCSSFIHRGKGWSPWRRTLSIGNSSNNSEQNSFIGNVSYASTDSSLSHVSDTSAVLHKEDGFESRSSSGSPHHCDNLPVRKATRRLLMWSDDDANYKTSNPFVTTLPKIEEKLAKPKANTQKCQHDSPSLPPLIPKVSYECISIVSCT